ncbi:glomulin-like [Glandiceps talaboti]
MADDLVRLAEELKNVPEKDIGDENKDVFLVTAKTLLEDGKFEDVKRILLDDNFEGLVKCIGWDFIPILCIHITEKQDENNNNIIDVLNRIALVCNPKEILLSLLEQVDKFLDNEHFKKFMNPMQTVLRRLPKHRSVSMNLVLSTFHAHLQTVRLPSNMDMSDTDKELLQEQDESIKTTERTLTAFLDFVTPFVFEIHSSKGNEITKENKTENEKMKVEIERFLLKLLDYPLSQLDLTKHKPDADDEKNVNGEDLGKSTFRCCAEQIMHYLRAIHCSYDRLIKYGKFNAWNYEKEAADKERERKNVNNDNEEIEDNIKEQLNELLPLLGISCFAYLTIVEEMEEDYLPSIYSPLYLMDLSLMYIISLFRRPEEASIAKGIELTFTLVSKMEDGSVPHEILDKSGYLEIAGSMERVMVNHPSRLLRQRAVQFLPLYIKKYDYHGRYKLLRHVLSRTRHSGVAGLLVGIIKDQVDEALKIGEGTEWFTGTHMLDLLKIAMTLEKGPLTDLLQESDRIMAVLNCLRFLILRDPVTENRSGIWSALDSIEEDYINLLEKGIGLSKSHFQQELQALLEQRKSKNEPNVDVNVSGTPLPGLAPEQQLQVFKTAQQMLDMMSSVLARLCEIIADEKKKGTTSS